MGKGDFEKYKQPNRKRGKSLPEAMGDRLSDIDDFMSKSHIYSDLKSAITLPERAYRGELPADPEAQAAEMLNFAMSVGGGGMAASRGVGGPATTGMFIGPQGYARLQAAGMADRAQPFQSRWFGQRYEINPSDATNVFWRMGGISDAANAALARQKAAQEAYAAAQKKVDDAAQKAYGELPRPKGAPVPREVALLLEQRDAAKKALGKAKNVRFKDLMDPREFPELAAAYPNLFHMPVELRPSAYEDMMKAGYGEPTKRDVASTAPWRLAELKKGQLDRGEPQLPPLPKLKGLTGQKLHDALAVSNKERRKWISEHDAWLKKRFNTGDGNGGALGMPFKDFIDRVRAEQLRRHPGTMELNIPNVYNRARDPGMDIADSLLHEGSHYIQRTENTLPTGLPLREVYDAAGRYAMPKRWEPDDFDTGAYDSAYYDSAEYAYKLNPFEREAVEAARRDVNPQYRKDFQRKTEARGTEAEARARARAIAESMEKELADSLRLARGGLAAVTDERHNMNYAQGGIATLHKKAQQLENASREPDTTLVHMAPNEIAALRQLAMEQYGTDLPRNPKTGLYEAGILSSLLGVGLSFIPGVGPMMAAGLMGGGTLLAGGKPKDALMNAIGAYGGAGLGSAMQGAAAQGAMAAGVPGADTALQGINPDLAAELAKQNATNAAAGQAAGQVAPQAVSQVAPQALTDEMAAQNAQGLNERYLRTIAKVGGAENAAFEGPVDASTSNLATQSPLDFMNQRIRTEGMAGFQQSGASAMPPASASPNYADLSFTDKMGYAGQHVAKDPWKFMTKEVGAGPTTIVGSGLMQAMNNPPEAKKLAGTFYDYDYDPDTGLFKERSRGSTPPWKAAAGGITPSFGQGGLADADKMYGMLSEMEAAVQGPSWMENMAQGGIARGRLLRGPGDGVSDAIPAMIDGQQRAALSTDEYVVPARVVAELGNGSSQAGAKKLDAMLARVEGAARKAKRGKDSNADRYLPA